MKWIPVLTTLVCLVTGEHLAVVRGVKEGTEGVIDINGFKVMVLDDMEEVGKVAAQGAEVESVEDVTGKRLTASSLCGGEDPNAEWGARSISGGSNYLAESYAFPQGGGGEGVVVYILDSGVRCSHAVFGGRCTFAANFADNIDEDEVGHGTHVAGIVAAVSQKAAITSIKVLDSSNTAKYADVLKGIAHAVSDIKAHGKPSVINLSLSSPFSEILNNAIAAIPDGTIVVTSAGNKAKDACDFSPGTSNNSINVGNVGFGGSYYPQRNSNHGKCIDIHAAGEFISSASNADDTSLKQLTGTSMATPHVAGVVANYLADGVEATHDTVLTLLQNTSHTDAIVGLQADTPNVLLHVPCSGATPSQDSLRNCFGKYAAVFNDSGDIFHPEAGRLLSDEVVCWQVSCPQSVQLNATYTLQTDTEFLNIYAGSTHTTVQEVTGNGVLTGSNGVGERVVQLLSEGVSSIRTYVLVDWKCIPTAPAPDTAAPDTAAPDTKAPDTKAPDTKAPDTAEPTSAPLTVEPTAAPTVASASEVLRGVFPNGRCDDFLPNATRLTMFADMFAKALKQDSVRPSYGCGSIHYAMPVVSSGSVLVEEVKAAVRVSLAGTHNELANVIGTEFTTETATVSRVECHASGANVSTLVGSTCVALQCIDGYLLESDAARRDVCVIEDDDISRTYLFYVIPLGCLAFFVIIGAVVFFCTSKNKKKDSPPDDEAPMEPTKDAEAPMEPTEDEA